MDDSPDSPDSLDELASAYLDDEVTPDERARVESDPDLLARVAELRVTVDAIRRAPSVPADERDRAVAAALADYDLLMAEAEAPATTPPPPDGSSPDVPTGATGRDLAAARLAAPASQAGRGARTLRWLGAAAAVAVLGTGIAKLGSGEDSESSSSASTDTVAAAGEAAKTADAPARTIGEIPGAADVVIAGENAADSAVAAETTAAAAAETFALPALQTVDDLRTFAVAALATRRDTTAGSPTPVAGTDDQAGSYGAACPDVAGVLLGPVVWQGADAAVYAVPDLDSPTSVVVLGPDCAVVTRTELTVP